MDGGVFIGWGAQLRIEVDGMGMKVLGESFFLFFFLFFYFRRNWRHHFVEMRGRSEGEMVIDAKGGLLGKLFPRGLTLSRFGPFGIYFPYYGDGWGSIVGSLDNCMQFAPDFLSSARYTSRMGWVKADTSVHSFHLSLLLRRGSRFFSKEVSISFKWWHVKDRFCTG